jgi:hypothetical protein
MIQALAIPPRPPFLPRRCPELGVALEGMLLPIKLVLEDAQHVFHDVSVAA